MQPNLKNILAGIGAMSILILSFMVVFNPEGVSHFALVLKGSPSFLKAPKIDSKKPAVPSTVAKTIASDPRIDACISKTEYEEEGVFINGDFSKIAYDNVVGGFYLVDKNTNRIRYFNKDGIEQKSDFPGSDHVFNYPISAMAVSIHSDQSMLYVTENAGLATWLPEGEEIQYKLGYLVDNREGALWKFYFDKNTGKYVEESLDFQNSNFFDKLKASIVSDYQGPKIVPDHLAMGINNITKLDSIFVDNLSWPWRYRRLTDRFTKKHKDNFLASRTLAIFNQYNNGFSDKFMEDSENNPNKGAGDGKWPVPNKIFMPPTTEKLNTATPYDSILGLAVDSQGNLVVFSIEAEGGTYRLKKFGIKNGRYDGSVNEILSFKTLSNSKAIYYDQLLIDKNDNLYFLGINDYSGSKSGEIFKLVSGEVSPTNLITSKFGNNTRDFTIDNSGSIYVVGPGQVFRYNPKWLCGKITIKKQVTPNRNRDVFTFQKNFDKSGSYYVKSAKSTPNFYLDDDGVDNNPNSNTVTFKLPTPDTYFVTEVLSQAYQTTITCVDPTKNTEIFTLAGRVSIGLDGNEEVVCTFKNNKCPVGQICAEGTDTRAPGFGVGQNP